MVSTLTGSLPGFFVPDYVPKLKPDSAASKPTTQKQSGRLSGHHAKDRRKSAVPVSSHHHEVIITTTQASQTSKPAKTTTTVPAKAETSSEAAHKCNPKIKEPV